MNFGEKPSAERIGEIWFTGAGELPLLVKFIFTSEALSVQVHPDDEQARARGYRHGKSECWYVLEAEPGATIGLGLQRAITRDELREAAQDGSIVDLLEWKQVRSGDFLFVPAGTVHAIGAGISLVEFQQNLDVTYRLYDYGRPRELHLDDAVAVAKIVPSNDPWSRWVDPARSTTLVDESAFSLDHLVAHEPWESLADRRRWVLPIEGEALSAGLRAIPGECMLLQPGAEVTVGSGRALIGAEQPVAGQD